MNPVGEDAAGPRPVRTGPLVFFRRHAAQLGLAALLVSVWAISFDRASRARFDFHHFYLDARYVWEHGELNPDLDDPAPSLRRQLPFYLPVVPLLLAPLTCGGLAAAAALWALGQTACVGVVLWCLLGWGRTPAMARLHPTAPNPQPDAPRYARVSPDGRGPARLVVVACLLALPAIYEAIKFNQLTFPVLALLLLALRALQRGAAGRAGVLIGLAAVLKLLPAPLAIWLLLKGQWRAAAALVVSSAVITLVPPLVVFGPKRTMEYHRQWWAHNVQGAPARGMAAVERGAASQATAPATVEEELPEHFVDRRNQALPIVLARWLSPEQPYHLPHQPLQLSGAACVWLARGVLAALLVGLMWLTRRAWVRLAPDERAAEFAAYLLAMMVLAPLLRQYYLAWALPALLVFLGRAIQESGGGSRWSARLALGLWLLGMAAWLWEPARLAGAHWLMLTMMGALLLAVPAPRPSNSASAVRHGGSV